MLAIDETAISNTTNCYVADYGYVECSVESRTVSSLRQVITRIRYDKKLPRFAACRVIEGCLGTCRRCTTGTMTASAFVKRGERAGRDWYARGAEELAEALLGQRLVRVMEDGTRLWGRIVETEAYVGVADRAAHSFGGRRTARNESMYAAPGTAYVYFTYGMHYCMNVVCGEVDEPVAVLLRALEPPTIDAGDMSRRAREVMRGHRVAGSRARRVDERDVWVCGGPARLCQALAIDKGLDGEGMVGSDRLWVEVVGEGPLVGEGERVARSARIGIGDVGVWTRRRLRWSLAGNSCVSRKS